jgi:hypothetical protein
MLDCVQCSKIAENFLYLRRKQAFVIAGIEKTDEITIFSFPAESKYAEIFNSRRQDGPLQSHCAISAGQISPP